MTAIGAGYGGRETEGAPVSADVEPDAEGKYTTTIGGVTIEANSNEELDTILNYLSLRSNKPISDLTESDVAVGLYSNSVYDVATRTFSVSPKGQDFLEEFKSGYFGDDVPYFPEGSEAYLGSNYNDKASGADAAAGVAGYQGAAEGIYNANYPPGQEPKPLTPKQVEQLDPEVVALLKALFGEDVVINTGHLNVLKAMSLVDGKTSALGSWGLTSGENGGGKDLLAEFKEVADASGEISPFLPSMGLFNHTQDKADEVKGMFDADGKLIEGKTPEEIEKAAQESVLPGMSSEASTPLPGGVMVPPGSPEQKMLNELLGKPANNTEFTAEEVNTAIAMGLMALDTATGQLKNSANGASYLAAAEASTGQPTGEGEPAGGDPNFGSYAEYHSHLHNETGIEATTDFQSGDSYSRDELKGRGFPDWFLDCLFINFANEDGEIDERTLGSMIKNGYLTHEYRDGGGRGGDRYGMTAKGVELIASDPTLSADQRKEIYITGMGMAEYATENDGHVHQKDYYGNAVARASDPAVREKYAAEYEKWLETKTEPVPA